MQKVFVYIRRAEDRALFSESHEALLISKKNSSEKSRVFPSTEITTSNDRCSQVGNIRFVVIRVFYRYLYISIIFLLDISFNDRNLLGIYYIKQHAILSTNRKVAYIKTIKTKPFFICTSFFQRIRIVFSSLR